MSNVKKLNYVRGLQKKLMRFIDNEVNFKVIEIDDKHIFFYAFGGSVVAVI